MYDATAQADLSCFRKRQRNIYPILSPLSKAGEPSSTTLKRVQPTFLTRAYRARIIYRALMNMWFLS